MTRLKDYLSLMKLRIDFFITLSGIVAAFATSKGPIPITHSAWLAAALMLASASAALFNQYADRDIDAIMARTRHRALPSGRVYPWEVFALGVIMGITGIGLALWAFNAIVAIYLFLGGFVYAVVYTVWLKRYTWMNIVIGGMSGSFSMLAGAAAIDPEVSLTPLLLALAMFFWTPSHFWSLAMARKTDYETAGIPMLPVVVGPAATAWAIFLNTGLLVISSLLPSLIADMGKVYFAAALLAGIYFLVQNLRLIRNPSQKLALANFKASMSYLTLLLTGIMLDVFWP